MGPSLAFRLKGPPSRHTTSVRRHIDVGLTSRRQSNVNMTSNGHRCLQGAEPTDGISFTIGFAACQRSSEFVVSALLTLLRSAIILFTSNVGGWDTAEYRRKKVICWPGRESPRYDARLHTLSGQGGVP